MVLDGDELLELPYIGERLKKTSSAAPSARGMLVCMIGVLWCTPGLQQYPFSMYGYTLVVDVVPNFGDKYTQP